MTVSVFVLSNFCTRDNVRHFLSEPSIEGLDKLYPDADNIFQQASEPDHTPKSTNNTNNTCNDHPCYWLASKFTWP